jgi:hypothetical protein
MPSYVEISEGKFVPIATALGNPSMRKEFLRQALADLEALWTRYGTLGELEPLFDAIELEKRRLIKRHAICVNAEIRWGVLQRRRDERASLALHHSQDRAEQAHGGHREQGR